MLSVPIADPSSIRPFLSQYCFAPGTICLSVAYAVASFLLPTQFE